MDETYIFTTLDGIKFFYKIRSSVAQNVWMVLFSYGSYKAPPNEKDFVVFNEELKTYGDSQHQSQAIKDLQAYVKN